MESVQNQLSAVRRARGVSAADLAKRVGVSRQTIYAIEAGSYVPNTEVTLRLAHELEVSVEELFSLRNPARNAAAPEPVPGELLAAPGSNAAAKGHAVRICRVAGRLIGVPVDPTPYQLPEADGVLAKEPHQNSRKATFAMFSPETTGDRRIALAGCDPAIGLVSNMAEKLSGGNVEIVSTPASSSLALEWLAEGRIHIAGSHIEDRETGEFNLPYLRLRWPSADFAVVTFARWEQGFVTARSNPQSIRTAADLARRSVRFVNREPGSGSRALLDRLLAEAGVPTKKVTGYNRVAHGHLPAAYLVRTGDADCCLATRSAARAFDLDFVPLRSERYDLVLLRESMRLPAVESFFETLQKSALRRKLEILAGYDTAQTGAVLA